MTPIKSTTSNYYSFELLADYVEGLVDSKTHTRISKHLQNHDYDAHVVEGIQLYYQQHNPSRANLEAFLDNFLTQQINTIQEQHKRTTKPIRRLITPMRIAASIGLLIVASIFAFTLTKTTTNPTALVDGYLATPYQTSGATRAQVSDWNNAIYQYEQQNYEQARENFEAIIQKDDKNTLAKFYLGLSCLYQSPSNPDQTISYLSDIDINKTRLKGQIRWFLSLAYYKTGKTEKTVELLNVITQDPKSFNYTKAKELLEKI